MEYGSKVGVASPRNINGAPIKVRKPKGTKVLSFKSEGLAAQAGAALAAAGNTVKVSGRAVYLYRMTESTVATGEIQAAVANHNKRSRFEDATAALAAMLNQ